MWGREYRRPGAEDVHRWLAFDRSGALRCRIQLDGGHELLEGGADHVLVRWRDEFDVEHLRMHRLSVKGENRAG